MENLFKFYFDFLSPISRPLWMLFEHAEVHCEKVQIALRKGEHLSESFTRDVNRFNKIPAITENGFKLSENVAIFHYLGRRGIIPERWYPKDLKTLAKIDEFLEWSHNNLFLGAGGLFQLQILLPLITKIQPTIEEILEQKRTLNRNLDDLENIWLKDNKYLTGNEITFADLIALSIIEQLLGMCLFKLDDEKHPKIVKWRNEVIKFLGPIYEEAHFFLYKYGIRLYNSIYKK